MSCSMSEAYLVLFQCLIFYHNYNYVMAIIGENVREAEENEFPAIVSLMKLTNTTLRLKEEHHKCTGTLVSRQDVLTAEHCIRTKLTEGFRIMIGSRDLRATTEYFPIFLWTYEHWLLYRHGNRTTRENDITIVKISANIPENIQFAPTANMPNRNLYGLHVDIAGWGRREDRSRVRILQTAKVRIMTYLECQSKYLIMSPVLAVLDERFLCSVADPHVLVTEGDSGGPVMFFGTAVAITKGVFPIGRRGPLQPDLMNLHLSLRFYREFFDDIITTFHVNL